MPVPPPERQAALCQKSCRKNIYKDCDAIARKEMVALLSLYLQPFGTNQTWAGRKGTPEGTQKHEATTMRAEQPAVAATEG